MRVNNLLHPLTVFLGGASTQQAQGFHTPNFSNNVFPLPTKFQPKTSRHNNSSLRTPSRHRASKHNNPFLSVNTDNQDEKNTFPTNSSLTLNLPSDGPPNNTAIPPSDSNDAAEIIRLNESIDRELKKIADISIRLQNCNRKRNEVFGYTIRKKISGCQEPLSFQSIVIAAVIQFFCAGDPTMLLELANIAKENPEEFGRLSCRSYAFNEKTEKSVRTENKGWETRGLIRVCMMVHSWLFSNETDDAFDWSKCSTGHMLGKINPARDQWDAFPGCLFPPVTVEFILREMLSPFCKNIRPMQKSHIYKTGRPMSAEESKAINGKDIPDRLDARRERHSSPHDLLSNIKNDLKKRHKDKNAFSKEKLEGLLDSLVHARSEYEKIISSSESKLKSAMNSYNNKLLATLDADKENESRHRDADGNELPDNDHLYSWATPIANALERCPSFRRALRMPENPENFLDEWFTNFGPVRDAFMQYHTREHNAGENSHNSGLGYRSHGRITSKMPDIKTALDHYLQSLNDLN